MGAFSMDGSASGPYFAAGAKIFLDVDQDTYIVSDTDDQIQFFAGGVEIAEFDADGIHFLYSAYFANGSQSAPGISFVNDPNSGFFRDTSDTINLSVAGAEIVEFDAVAVTLADGTDLVISAADKLFFDGGGDTYLYEESPDDWHVIVGGSVYIQIDQDINAMAIGLSASPDSNRALVFSGAFTPSGGAGSGIWMEHSGTLTGQSGNSSFLSLTSLGGNIITQNATENIAVVSSVRMSEPNINASALNGDITVAATLHITGVPTEAASNENYAIYMPTGAFGVSDGAGGDGEQLTSGGPEGNLDWSADSCVRSSKTAIMERDNNDEVLATLVNTPVHDFKYKNDKSLPSTGDYDTDYVGIMADEAPWAMHHSGRILNPINAFGYTIQAFKALEKRIQELESSNGN
jgi:hypothetical protein